MTKSKKKKKEKRYITSVSYLLVESNPIRKVESPKRIEKVTMHDVEDDIFPFSETEIKMLLEKTDGYLKNFIMLMYASGMRPGEISLASTNPLK